MGTQKKTAEKIGKLIYKEFRRLEDMREGEGIKLIVNLIVEVMKKVEKEANNNGS